MSVDQLTVEAKLHELATETDPEFVQDVVNEFLSTTPSQVVEIQDALNREDLVKAGRTAHSLKANCATFGLSGLAHSLQRLEHCCRNRQLAEASMHLIEIKTSYALSRPVLSEVLGRIR